MSKKSKFTSEDSSDDLDDYIYTPVSSHNIERYINGTVFSDTNFKVRKIKDLHDLSMHDLFTGNRTFEIFFIENPEQEIGHFVTLIHRDSESQSDHSLEGTSLLELFDPAGTRLSTRYLYDYLAEDIQPFADRNNVTVAHNRSSFQAEDSMTCARSCILRAMLSHLETDDFLKVVSNDNFDSYDEFFATVIRF